MYIYFLTLKYAFKFWLQSTSRYNPKFWGAFMNSSGCCCPIIIIICAYLYRNRRLQYCWKKNKIQLLLKWFFSNRNQIYNFLDHYFALRKWLSRKCQKIHFWNRNELSILSYNLHITHWHIESTHWISETIWALVETIFEKFQEDEWHFCWANSF